MPPEPRGRTELLRRFLEQRHAGSMPRWAEAVSRCLTIDDLRQLIEHRVPPVVTDYFLGGAGSEQTMRDNVEAFARARFNPRYGVKHAKIDLATTLLGHTISMPVVAAPVGSLRTLWPRGEAVAARAVGDAGTIYCLSTLTGTALEEVRTASSGPCWFPLPGGRSGRRQTGDRASQGGRLRRPRPDHRHTSGRRAIARPAQRLVTVISGRVWQKAKFVPMMMRHLSWLTSFYADGGLMQFPNIDSRMARRCPTLTSAGSAAVGRDVG